MRKRQPDHSDTMFKLVIALALLLTLGIGVWYYKSSSRETPPPQPAAPASAPVPAKPAGTAPEKKTVTEQKPFDYNKSEETYTDVMERRKAEHGLDESVDMIVKPKESVIIGDELISMYDILERIRIKEGRMVEEDLMPPGKTADSARKERLFTRLKTAEKKYHALETELGQPEAGDTSETLPDLLAEQERVGQILQRFDKYKGIARQLDHYNALLEAESPHETVRDLLHTLEQEKEEKREQLVKSLTDMFGALPSPLTDERLFLEKKRVEERLRAIRGQLSDPAISGHPDQLRALLEERKQLKKIEAQFRGWQYLTWQIDELSELAGLSPDELKAGIRKKAEVLRIWQKDMEDAFASELLKNEKIALYGIYLVRPGDNVWNIHFQFLKEYFKNKDITLSPLSDEPDDAGVSSGIGKILKFSENMVYIYNLKEKVLTDNLNLLTPLSKIVVFNMGNAFEILQHIEESRIKEIRYDGETLWLPAQ